MPGDIFISYARKDDRAPDLPGAQGFVTSLHNQLLAAFEDRGPPTPTIFRDVKQIEAADQFKPRLGRALQEARLLVVVLSRNWLAPEREWCHLELATFVEFAQGEGASEAEIKERILVVRRHAIPRGEHPQWLQGQSGFDLLEIDRENGKKLPFFNADRGRVANDRWFTTIGTLADDLRRRAGNLPPTKRTPDTGPTVTSNGRKLFVGRPAGDMEGSWKIVVEELTRRGFKIVPEPAAPLSLDGTAAAGMIRSAVADAELSIHLLGEGEGFRPEGATPIVRLQLDLAAARLRNPNGSGGTDAFHRLIWAPRILPGTTEGSPPREPFQVLAKHSGLPDGTSPEQALHAGDKLHGDTLAKLVDFLIQHLALVAPRTAEPIEPLEEGAEVYVEHHEVDRGHALVVARGLRDLGLKPALPASQGDPAQVAAWHRRNLKRCAAVVLCWARSGDVWVLATADEHDDPSLGRERPFKSRTVVLLPPPEAIKTDAELLVESVGIRHLIDASADEPTPETLKLKLQALRGLGA